MWSAFKRKLHKKVLVCMGIPYTRDSFFRLFSQGSSDFIKSLKSTYGISDVNSLWEKYRNLAEEAEKSIACCMSRGASVIDKVDDSVFRTFKNYDVVVIVAHHPENNSVVEINGEYISEEDFTNSFPEDFDGIVDLTSCYSTNLQYKLKAHCTSDSFHTIAVDNKTPLNFRLLLFGIVIDELCHKDIEYITAYQRAIDIIRKILPNARSISKRDVVYLGGEMKSTVYAPAEVNKGDSFIVQLFIHKKDEDETVEIMAKYVDEQASVRNVKSLPIKLKRNDKIESELTWQGNNKECFTVDKKRKSAIWTNEPISIEYCIDVSSDCPVSSFIGKIKLTVNKQNAGEILFKTKVQSESSINAPSSDIVFVPYHKAVEMESESNYLFGKIDKELEGLNSSLQCVSTEKERLRIEHKIDICKRLFQILNSDPAEIDKSVIKVFISSTSDMVKYRDILKKQITDLKMYPISYDNWSQEDMYPRDVCCKKVMASDIFVCVLGAKYGFVEPEWSMSMTEIEYRVAVLSGLPILIYIIEDYEKKMSELPDVYRESVFNQKRLIEELKTKRLVELFSTDLYLQMKSCEELTRLKTQLELGKI